MIAPTAIARKMISLRKLTFPENRRIVSLSRPMTSVKMEESGFYACAFQLRSPIEPLFTVFYYINQPIKLVCPKCCNLGEKIKKN